MDSSVERIAFQIMSGRVIWITGLSGSGKTTLALELQSLLKSRGEMTILLDGDDLRSALGAEKTAYDREGRKRLAFTYARLCRLLSLQEYTVICATISLFHDVHKWNRENLPGYFEVFLDVTEEERRRRDPKQLYVNLDSGNVSNMAGVDVDVEFPLAPDLKIMQNSTEGSLEITSQVASAFYRTMI
jgi:adenylylsulfate kinase